MNTRLEDVRSKIQALDAIPAIPAVVMPLASMLRQPAEDVNLRKVVDLISYDSTIASQCLRMANSPLFGRRAVETISSAVITLGLSRVQAITLGCCLRSVLPADKWAIDVLTFWRHSLGCALVSSKMAHLIGYPDPEKAYACGLLHDLGILVNSLVATDEFRRVLRMAMEEKIPLHRMEQEYVGYTHAETGRILAECWHLPDEFSEVMQYHHDVANARIARALVALVHLSDLLCRLRDLGHGYYEAIGVDLSGDLAWSILVEHYPALERIDLARVSMDIDGKMEEITATVNAVFV